MGIEIRNGKTNEVILSVATMEELKAEAQDFKRHKYTEMFKVLHYIRDAMWEGKTTKFEIGGALLGKGYNVKFD